MTDTMKVIIGVLLPFLGTSLGAASVFFMKGEMNPKLQKALLGFASGVMVAASVWSLIMPGIEMAEAAGKIAWLPAAAGFLGGMFFLLILDIAEEEYEILALACRELYLDTMGSNRTPSVGHTVS